MNDVYLSFLDKSFFILDDLLGRSPYSFIQWHQGKPLLRAI